MNRRNILKFSDLKQLQPLATVISGHEQMSERLQHYMAEYHIDPLQLHQEIEMDSRYAQTHQDRSVSAMGLHSHIFYEIIYVRSGDLQYLLGTERYQLHSGDIVFVPPNVSHRALLNGDGPYDRYVVWLSTEFVALLRGIWPQLRLNVDRCRLLRPNAKNGEPLRRSFQHGVSVTEEASPGWELEVLGNTIQLVVQLERAFSDTQLVSPERAQRELLDDIVEYIEHHLAEKITLEATARQFLVSRSTVSHTFQQRMEVSFYRFVTQRRLIAAKNRILTGEPMSSIAEQVGFGDYSAFYRAFKQEYNISPRDYARWCAGHESL